MSMTNLNLQQVFTQAGRQIVLLTDGSQSKTLKIYFNRVAKEIGATNYQEVMEHLYRDYQARLATEHGGNANRYPLSLYLNQAIAS